MADPEAQTEKSLKVPVETHRKLARFCRALEVLDFQAEREYNRVSAGDAIDRLLDQEWARDILARAKGPPGPQRL